MVNTVEKKVNYLNKAMCLGKVTPPVMVPLQQDSIRAPTWTGGRQP